MGIEQARKTLREDVQLVDSLEEPIAEARDCSRKGSVTGSLGARGDPSYLDLSVSHGLLSAAGIADRIPRRLREDPEPSKEVHLNPLLRGPHAP